MVQGIGASVPMLPREITREIKPFQYPKAVLNENNRKAHANSVCLLVALVSLSIFLTLAGVALVITGALIANPAFLGAGIGVLAGTALGVLQLYCRIRRIR